MSRASISGSAIVLGACLLALLAAPSARAQQGEGEKTRMSAAELKEWISKRTDCGAVGGAGMAGGTSRVVGDRRARRSSVKGAGGL